MMVVEWLWLIYCDNDVVVVVFGEVEYGIVFDNLSFFYILISVGFGGSVVIDCIYYCGVIVWLGELGLMFDQQVGVGVIVQDIVLLFVFFVWLKVVGYVVVDVDVFVMFDVVVSDVIDDWFVDVV